jgi:hypothetical protein
MKHFLETVFGWLATSRHDVVESGAIDSSPSEAERRLRELQERGRVQFLP